jgi:hypothetical protein
MRDLVTHMHKCCRDDDTSTELFDDRHDDTTTLESAEREEDRSEYTNGCRCENGKHKTNTQRDVVVAIDGFTGTFHSVAICVDAMPNVCQLKITRDYYTGTHSTPAWKWQLTPSAETSPAGSSPSVVCAWARTSPPTGDIQKLQLSDIVLWC